MRNTLIVSLLGLVPLLILYVVLIPGFVSHLASGGPALSRFLRQVLTNGLPVVFTVNYVGLFLAGMILANPEQTRSQRLLLLVDLPLRVAVFFFLHTVIYALSADWFGSFGGSKSTALKVVAPTLAQSALFANLSGVYLYATLLPSFPLYAVLFENIRNGSSSDDGLPGRAGPWIAAATVCGTFALVLTGLARVIVWLQT